MWTDRYGSRVWFQGVFRDGVDLSIRSLQGVFVVGTDTEVGKTYQSALLARKLAGAMRVGVYKPVASGVDMVDPLSRAASDAEILRDASRGEWPIERVCPQYFRAAVAPPVAARLEGCSVDEMLLVTGAHWWREECEFLIVEGAGGVLSPVSDSLTVLDLAERLGFPVAIVAVNRIGVVNQVLLAVQAIDARGLDVKAIVLNNMSCLEIGSPRDDSIATNRELLEQFLPRPIPLLDSLDDLPI